MSLRTQGSRYWRDVSYAVLDFETTGLDLSRDHVLSYGLVPIERGRIRLRGALYRVVHPPVAVSEASIRVHGLRPSEVVGAPTLDEVADELEAALEGRTLVAYAAHVELAFLRRLGGRRRHHVRRRVVDVLDLAARADRLERVAPPITDRLADLAAHAGVPVARTHHALGDALTTAHVFLVLATRLERHGLDRLRDLTRRRSRRMQFAKSFVQDPLERTGPVS